MAGKSRQRREEGKYRGGKELNGGRRGGRGGLGGVSYLELLATTSPGLITSNSSTYRICWFFFCGDYVSVQELETISDRKVLRIRHLALLSILCGDLEHCILDFVLSMQVEASRMSMSKVTTIFWTVQGVTQTII